MAEPLLGWIAPEDRTQEQADAHAAALASMPAFALPEPTQTGPVKVMLTDFWKDPEVIADVGFEFNGFRQLTGSCVGVSDGNAVFTVAAVQRNIADNPTKAFVPFWPFMYGRCRYLEGDHGQGEGAVDSVMGTQNVREGILDTTDSSLPKFNHTDGLAISAKLELQWSDGGSVLVTQHLPAAKPHLMGTRAPIYDVSQIRTAILNGYPVLDGCQYFVGKGSIYGDGQNAYCRGKYTDRGGHSTCVLGYWDHPSDGPLYLYSNQWDASTYPKDPAGAGRCCVWLTEKEMSRLFQLGGDGGETMALSHLNYFPVQVDKILDWMQA